MGRGPARVLVVAAVTGVLMAGDSAVAVQESPPIRLPITSTGFAHRVVVEPGDHLWKISDRHLSDVYGRDALDQEVSPYWRLVIAENRDSLRSGDPDLIYPGEIVVLPPLP